MTRWIRGSGVASVSASFGILLFALSACSGNSGDTEGAGGSAADGNEELTGNGGTSEGVGTGGRDADPIRENGVPATGGGGGTGGTPDLGPASGGATSVAPVMHLFLLMGQSNMAGVAKNEAGDQNTDDRLKVWGGCNQPAGQWNTANPPLNDCPGEKGWNLSDSVGPGMWFAKTIAAHLPPGDTVGLIGTAESGESINTFIAGGSHHQMILNKIAAVKDTENARFAGIIFHQGETDTGQSTWPDKVVQLYGEVKAAFGVDYDVPMILGELPEAACCSSHNPQVHLAADKLPLGSWVSQAGTSVLDEYHFDHASVLLMGQRYGDAMVEALGW